ncbi:alginate export family protein [Phenylobacterium sp.]|uniref:alginate export family protein n=1 Tax=Phenylobacterium sp. TaxID=1871053 RepID=UPI002C08F29E|nr:alginate export family protein [Phenylobacterium sp.]HVI33720.1 alginate export family protein [Phenylobacterium sp.]
MGLGAGPGDGAWRRRGGAALVAFAVAAGAAAAAEPVPCPAQPIRWKDDCAGLAHEPLTGLDRLRYLPVGAGWVSLGGELRVRLERMDAADFGIAGGPAYLQLGRRAMAHADLHLTPRLRVFGQLAAAEADGRRPGPRPQDQDELDVAQLFVDAPLRLGETELLARLGRQEIDLSGNRLVTTRDGVTIRRTFQGALGQAARGDVRLTVFALRPTRLRRGAFDDGPNDGETFRGASVDYRPPAGLVTAFVFRRARTEARFADHTGPERRWTAGLRYAVRQPAWAAWAQADWQWGEASNQTISASSAATGASYTFDAPRRPTLGAALAYASGDRRRGDGELGTFDPLYPNAFGLSDAPFIYQTNYRLAAIEGSAVFGGAELGLSGFLVARDATGDAVYAGGRPLPGVPDHGRLTAVLGQADARLPLTPRTELYLSAVCALPGEAVRQAGGHSGLYARVQLTTRF